MRRLQKRVVDKTTKAVNYVDTSTVQIVFEGKVLPPSVKIYRNWNKEVQEDILNVKFSITVSDMDTRASFAEASIRACAAEETITRKTSSLCRKKSA